MKNNTLLLLAFFLMVSTIEASENRNANYVYNNAVNFSERGIEFYIFTNGEFDFNTHYNSSYSNYNGYRNTNNGVQIERGFNGTIRRIDNVFLNYDARGNITRIGNVFIRYTRGRVSNVGNLTIRYNSNGYPVFYGNVKDNYYYHNGRNINLNIGMVCNFNDAYFYRNDFRKNYSQVREDANFYYYSANANANIGKRNPVLKRRKATNTSKYGVRSGNTNYYKNPLNKISNSVNFRNQTKDLENNTENSAVNTRKATNTSKTKVSNRNANSYKKRSSNAKNITSRTQKWSTKNNNQSTTTKYGK